MKKRSPTTKTKKIDWEAVCEQTASNNLSDEERRRLRDEVSGHLQCRHRSPSRAVDTNVLLRLADGHHATVDAWELIKRRLRPVQFLIGPTALDEIANLGRNDPDPDVKACAHKALVQMRSRWHVHPADFNAVQEALAANATHRLRDSGLLPYSERNDAAVIAEAAVLNCVLLVSRDSHLLAVEHEKLAFLFRQLDLPVPLISSPEDLLKKFYT